MLVRPEGDAVLLIAQPAHAAVAGQLARAWGNERFGAVEPFAEVCLGAELHDIGWVEWERNPTLNPSTGLPHTFLEVSAGTRADIWGPAAETALPFGRYAALLVSLHGTGLYEMFGVGNASAVDAERMRQAVERNYRLQERLLVSLRGDEVMGDYASDAAVRRNRRLVAAWDGMSLALCHGLTSERAFRAVPAADGEIDVTFRPAADSVTVDPWPFSDGDVAVRIDCRRVAGRFTDEAAMRAAIDAAEWVTLSVRLRPASAI
jgi:hypothetical protein